MRRWFLLAIAAALLAGCSWTQSRFDPAQTGFNPATTITPANVGSLAIDFFGVVPSGTPLARNFRLFVPTSNNVSVIDARGQQGCMFTPPHCAPLWQTDSAPAFSGFAIAGATLAVLHTENLVAYDANGVQNCSGTPKTCTPLWTGKYPGVSPQVFFDGVATTDDVIYVHVADCTDACAHGVGATGEVAAFDARGVQNCTGTPKVCTPLWIGRGGDDDFGLRAPTIAGGKVYLSTVLDAHISIFDANGVQNCGGSPKTCTEIGGIGPALFDATELAVAQGKLFAPAVTGSLNNPLFLRAYDANGGSTPLWSSNVAVNRGTPAVANGRVFVVRNDASRLFLLAYDANGTTNCSGTPKVCSPLFTGDAGSAVSGGTRADIIVVGDVVYVSVANGVFAFDARGRQGCSGTPPNCTALFKIPPAFTMAGHPIVVWDHLYVPTTERTGLSALHPLSKG